jgi:peptide-methionine (R)-S-oxide reductase
MTPDPQTDPRSLSDEQWRERLSPDAYTVLRRAGTERPWTGKYVDTKDPGTYRCAACGQELFDAATKFESHSGWPSFTSAVRPDAVELKEDFTLGMVRVEVLCSRCGSHLGHVFDDGPREAGGKRFCMNSVSLDLDAARR